MNVDVNRCFWRVKMTKKQAMLKAKRLNATRYKLSRLKVKPMKYGNVWVLVGFAL